MHQNDRSGAPRVPDAAGGSGSMGPIFACLGVLLASAVIFHFWTWIDLGVSGWFYEKGVGFPLGKTPLFRFVRSIGIWITTLTVVALIAVGLYWRWRPEAVDRWPSPRPWTDWLFMTLTMALGPGALVHLIFKPLFGRPRPVQTAQFGGAYDFTPAWGIGHPFSGPLSFVSGEAAASASILAFAFIVPQRWRVAVAVIGCLITVTMSAARVAVGGHYVSDVVTAWILMLLVMFILKAQIYDGKLLGPLKRLLPQR